MSIHYWQLAALCSCLVLARTARNILVRLILIHYVSGQKGFPSENI